jgi:hypothetical protein
MTNHEKKAQLAITVKNISKRFTIPHEKTNTLKGAFVNIFRKNTYEKVLCPERRLLRGEEGRVLRHSGAEWQRQVHIAEDLGRRLYRE